MARKWMLLVLVALLLLPMAVSAQETMDDMAPPPGFASWDAVLEEARGQTVNWYMWGGSDSINEFVDTFYGEPLLEEYGITLNRVPLADTVDAVNQVLSESEAGVGPGEGTIDLIWINGENFFTMRQAELLYGPWAQNIPNSMYVDWENPAVALDFGRPVDGYESPWSSAQFNFIYDTARMSAEDLPRSYAELTEWAIANPGRFTYIAPGPGAFLGTRFVKQIFFEVSGGQEQWVGEFNQELYDQWAPVVWELLNAWEPYLWRQGETYPASEAELHELFANGEVDFDFTNLPSGASTFIETGQIPPTSQAFTFETNMIGDFNYVAIPYNAPNVAAALVLANLMLRPDLQAAQVQPANGFGLGYGIDVSTVSEEEFIAAIEEAALNMGAGAAPAADLAASLVSDIAAEYQALIEADWEANVLRR
ncbi:MAG: ABC transporter substrate-binding protein [Chloroflexi bacterium]|nr:ABC transporter substrate-binding protein [Chloroflexota bacterium]